MRLARWAPPLLVLAVAVGAGVLLALARGDGPVAREAAPSRSSTLALVGDALWVTSPDDGAVVELDPATLEERRRVAVAGQPTELTASGGRLVVTRAQADEVTVLDVGSGPVRATAVPVPCGGTHAAVVSGSTAYVTCPHDDRVATIDLATGRAGRSLVVPGRPTGVVTDGRRLTVSSAVGGTLRTWDLGALDAAPTITTAWADGRRSPSLLGPLDLGPRGPVGAYQVVDNLRTAPAEELARGGGSYGEPLEGRARIEPALAGPCGARFADATVAGRGLALPVALAAGPDDLVWVVGRASRSVAVVRCAPGAPGATSDLVATFALGHGARGIVLAEGGRRAYVDVGFDHAVARLDLPADAAPAPPGPLAPLDPGLVVRRPVGTTALSPLAEEGRRLFNDATDEHLTPHGVVACASCHPGGGDDGLTWQIETAEIDRKVRRTPPVWALAPGAEPLHWDGEHDDVDGLVLQTVRELLGGDGLLVDAAAVTAYMAELPAPPPAPARTADERAAVARGAEAFAGLCAGCHAGPRGTDGRPHHGILPGGEPAAALDAAVTPPLAGVRGRAPYGHDGRAPDLPALLDAHGGSRPLTARERADLLAYLDTR